MLKKKKVLTIVSKDYDDLELWYPIIRLREAGATVLVAAEKTNETYVGKSGLLVESDLAFADVNPKEFDAILIPGGWSPDYLRRLPDVLNIVKTMHEDNKVIGQSWHAGWVVASANILKQLEMVILYPQEDRLIYHIIYP